MNQNKWNKHLFGVKYPASLTTEVKELKQEAKQFAIKGTTGMEHDEPMLVLGCGDGYELEKLRELGFKDVTGITLLEEEAHRNIEGVVVGDIHDMPFKDGQFKNVISKETLEHCVAPAIALAEINRVMQDGGRFCHYIPCGTKKQRDWYHYLCAPPWVWVDLMYKAGFEVQSFLEDIGQIKYEGYKDKEPGWMTELYDLDEYATKADKDNLLRRT